MLPIIFWSGPVPTCFSTSMRTVSRSRPSFCKTFTATPCPSLISPSNRCSVPTKLWLKRSASLRASASTCCARGVKLFIASSGISLINYFTMLLILLFVQSIAGRGRWLGNRAADGPQALANHVCTQQVAFLRRELFRVLLLQVRRLGQDEQLIGQRPVHTGKQTNIHTQPHQGEQIHRFLGGNAVGICQNAVRPANMVIDHLWLLLE